MFEVMRSLDLTLMSFGFGLRRSPRPALHSTRPASVSQPLTRSNK